MFVNILKTGKGGKNQYVRLVEGYRDENGKNHNRVIKNFGRLDELLKRDPLFVENLKRQYETQRSTAKTTTAKLRVEQAMETLVNAGQRPVGLRPPKLLYGHYPLNVIWTKDLAMPARIKYLQKKTRCQFDLNSVLSSYVFLKIMDPSSYRFGFSKKDFLLGDPLKGIALEDCYRALGHAKTFKDQIFKGINRTLDGQFGKDRATMVFYDVTNAYFESELTDAEREYEQADFADRLRELAQQARESGALQDDCFDDDGNPIASKLPDSFLETVQDEKIQYLRMRGPSKEHRFDLPIVSIVLIIDQNGLPMDFEVFSGNTSEFRSMKGVIERLKEKHKIQGAVVVADRGLNSVKNLLMLRSSGMGYLVAQKVTQFPDAIYAKMFDQSRYSDIDPEHPEAGRYQVIPNWRKKGKDGEKITCKLVLTYNEKRKRRDEAILDLWVEIVKRKMQDGTKVGPRKTGWAALAKTADDVEQPIVGIDEEALERKRKLCGFAALVYDESPEDAEASDGQPDKDECPVKEPERKAGKITGSFLADSYHNLVRIEECFRIMKSNLGLRPMRVYNSDHVRGHVTLCVLALLVLKLLQHRLRRSGHPMSIDKISRVLRQARVGAVKSGEDAIYTTWSDDETNLREDREWWSDEKLEELAAELAKNPPPEPIDLILTACDLHPLPVACNTDELGRCLRVRFSSYKEAIPSLNQCRL